MNTKSYIGFRILIIFSIILLIFLLVGQSFALINYDFLVSIGLQESVEEITLVGIAFAKGFAFGDTVIYIPLIIAGVVGLLKRKRWGFHAFFGSLAISVYWPLVHLFAIIIEQEAITLPPGKYLSFYIILPLIASYGLWGMWYLYKHQNILMK